jgi:molybdate transport system substrate-binding protein
MHSTQRICAAALLLGSISAAGLAAEVQVLSAGAMQPGLIASAAAFRQEAGHDIKVTYAIASELRKRVGGGEVADIVIAPPAVTGDLVKAGKVSAQGQVALGRVGAGVVARNGAPLPDISSAEALKRSLLDADSVVYNRASSGVYIDSMLKQLGVFEQIGAKLIRYDDGTAVMHHLMQGRGREFGFGGITDILMYRDKGLQLVGPLPEEIQNYTSYTAALITAAANPDAAKAFLRYLGSTAGKALFMENGIK